MEIIISGRHVAVTPGLRAYALERAERLRKYFDGITKITVTLAVDSGRQSAEMVISASRNLILIGEVEDRDLYAAIDLVTDKMGRQLKREKEKMRSHRRQQPLKHAQAEFEAPAEDLEDGDFDEDLDENTPPAQ